MLKFIVKRCALAVPTLLILVTITFFLIQMAPGSPFTSERQLSPQVLANIKAMYHMDKPLWQQYLYYLGNLAHGDLGPSFKYADHTVNQLLASSFPVSLRIGALAFIAALVLGVAIGTLAACKQNSLLDYCVMAVAMTGIVLPSFVLAPLLVLVFSVNLHWLPAGGWNHGHWANVVLPVTAMTIMYMASIARIQRGSMIEVLNSHYIRTARAKGLPWRIIIMRHALRPSLLPVVSYLGPAFVGVITGSVVVETVFGLPGTGQHFVHGALNRDYSLVLGLTLVIGALTILFTAVVDILYGLIDPKVRCQ